MIRIKFICWFCFCCKDRYRTIGIYLCICKIGFHIVVGKVRYKIMVMFMPYPEYPIWKCTCVKNFLKLLIYQISIHGKLVCRPDAAWARRNHLKHDPQPANFCTKKNASCFHIRILVEFTLNSLKRAAGKYNHLVLLSTHGAAALGAMCGIAQHTHSDDIAAGCALKPVAGNGDFGNQKTFEQLHCNSSIYIFSVKTCLHLSHTNFQNWPPSEQRAWAENPHLGQVFFSINNSSAGPFYSIDSSMSLWSIA